MAKNKAMYNQTSIQAAISAALGDAPNEIRVDGHIHRFRVDRSADAGWYVAHNDTTVTFGDWRNEGAKQTWFAAADLEPLPTADRIAQDAQRAADRAAREAEQSRKAATAAQIAAAIWNAAPLVAAAPLVSFIPAAGSPWREIPPEKPSVHPYLDRKQIGPHRARLLTPEAAAVAPGWIQEWIFKNDLIRALIVPAGNAGKLATLQFIRADGVKKQLPHGSIRGARYILGRLTDAEIIIIVEGFATGASIHEATGLPVVVAFDAGNLATIAAGIRRDHPAAKIILAGDNDIRPAGSQLENTGVVAARKASLLSGATVAIPELAGKKCDWNDVAVALGREEVARQFRLIQSELVPINADSAPELPTATVAATQLKDALDRLLDRVGTPEQQDMAIRAAAGLGKSTQTLKAIHERGLTADYFAPSHRLAAEQVARLPPGVAVAIRGRDHQDADHPIPLCAKHESVTALQKAGLGYLSAQLLCGKIDPATGKRPCPHAAGCGYLKQFNSTAPIRFYAHEWLPMPEREQRKPDVVVIDESFRDALERRKSWEIADLFAAGPLYRTLIAGVADGNLIEVATPHLAAIDAAIDAAPLSLPDIHPEMNPSEALAKIAGLEIDRAGHCLSFLRAVKRAVESNEPLSIWYVEKKKEYPAKIHTAYTAPIKFVAAKVPRLYLDASLQRRIVDTVSPGVEFVDIAASRNAHVVQVADTALAGWRLKADNDHLSSRIIELVTRKAGENPNGSIIAPKDWLAAHGSRLPCCVKQAHYGALRGLNKLEAADWMVVVGRNEPPPWGVESIARAWFSGDPDFRVGTVTREQATLTARNGDTATITRTAFTDRRCQEILESIREQESLQAVDRLRLIHAARTKTIYLLCNLPLPGLPPDELVALDDLLLPGRIAEVMLRDFAVAGPKALAARHPDLFPTVKTAQHVMDDFAAGLNTPFPYIGSYRQKGYLNIATYRTSGTAGKPRRALLSVNLPPAMVAGLLEEIHGKPVTILEIAPRIAAPVDRLPPDLTPEPENPGWAPPAEDWKPIQPDPEPLYWPILPDPEPLFRHDLPQPPTTDRPYTIYPNRYACEGIPA